ncbi:ABC transporter substrate-binding protein [Streptomyces sp. NBC_00525]|uniref:ABC transporter substrate-binding protein n=1 Tax=Streptomyces sp. NBC_00525 TaxID=2903660 RepID=UPI002E814F42|nr:ABC transporter substrate-binding protein [Streptomyces sp. NBC_00525]WUC92860.1 ABC transporter substrate-binding protein [Streptomyces sp. NBC_00525]
MKRKTLVLPAVAGLLAPVLAGCGAPDGGGTDTGPVVVGTTDRIAASTTDPAPLDPATAHGPGAQNVLRQTVQTLLATPRGGGAPVPDAAENCRFTDSRSESYRCRLRTGLTFADSTPVTPDDVAHSIDRVRRIGADGGPAALLDSIDTVETAGTRDIVFHLRTPDAAFPYKLATPAAGIVPRAHYPADAARDGFRVDGSGPYTMKAEVRSGRLVKATFTRNPRYRGSHETHDDTVELDVFPDAAAMEKAFDARRVDVMAHAMSTDRARRLLAEPEDGVRLTEMPGLAIGYLGFDTGAPAVRDRAVRRAVARSVDRGRIASRVRGGTVEPLYSPIPAGVTAHANAFYSAYGEPDTAGAAALLKKAEVPTPVRFTLHYPDDRHGPETAAFDAVAKQLNDTGLFDVTARGVPRARFGPALLRGDYAVHGTVLVPDFPDPDAYTAPLLGPAAPPEARTLVDRSRRTADRTAAVPALERLQDVVARDVPVLPLWQETRYTASLEGVGGVEWAVGPGTDLRLWELRRGSA